MLRINRNENYKTISCKALDDKELSFKAKGIHTYLITRPDNWHFSMAQIYSMGQEGEVSFNKAVKELKDKGYLVLTRSRGLEGKIVWTWDIFESPKNHTPEFQGMENHGMVTGGNKHTVVNNKELTKVLTTITREEFKAPPVPSKVTDTLEIGHKFPYEKVNLAVSALWYWGVNRHSRHGLDFFFTKESFKKLAVSFNRNIIPQIGKEWDKIVAYIDWYLVQKDGFIDKQTSWGPDYLTSTHALNKFTATKGDYQLKMITSDEERKQVKGKWLK